MRTFLRRFYKTFLGLFLGVFFLPFLISPVYNFPEYAPFSGDKIWNPYEGIDSTQWQKGNFQIQSLAWGGITDGSNNPTEDIYELYESLDYDIIGISDYMKINKYYDNRVDYIPIYEHGYNIRKTHQVNIGAKKVYWLDFPLYQTTSHKQFMINQLRDKTDLMTLAHPNFSLEGYSHNDLKHLVNYDLIETLNHQRFSFSHWDAALSNGHAKYILANDDAHDIRNPYLVGVVATMINAPSNTMKDIIPALLEGKSYGYVPRTENDETYDKKRARLDGFAYLNSATLEGDTFSVSFSMKARRIDFVGQNGEIKDSVFSASTAKYAFQPDDTYIRVEANLGNGGKIYLNPIFRYEGDNPLHEEEATINWWKSILMWVLSWSVFVFLIKRLFRRW